MATWFRIEFEGEPTEADFARVARLAGEGYTSGQLINEPGAEDEEHTPEELAYQRAQIAAGFGDPYAQD